MKLNKIFNSLSTAVVVGSVAGIGLASSPAEAYVGSFDIRGDFGPPGSGGVTSDFTGEQNIDFRPPTGGGTGNLLQFNGTGSFALWIGNTGSIKDLTSAIFSTVQGGGSIADFIVVDDPTGFSGDLISIQGPTYSETGSNVGLFYDMRLLLDDGTVAIGGLGFEIENTTVAAVQSTLQGGGTLTDVSWSGDFSVVPEPTTVISSLLLMGAGIKRFARRQGTTK